MNIIVKIITGVIVSINRILDSFDTKTVSMIKNSFYGLIFILAIFAIIIGYRSGRGSAKQFGKPLIEFTNSIFETKLNKERLNRKYKSMLDSELIEEAKEVPLKKIDFPASETLNPETKNKVAEPEPDIKRNSREFLDTTKIAETNRTDDKIIKPDVRELKKMNPKIKTETTREVRPIDTDSRVIEK